MESMPPPLPDGHVGGDRRVSQRQHAEVLDAAAVAAAVALLEATVTPFSVNTPSFRMPPPVLA